MSHVDLGRLGAWGHLDSLPIDMRTTVILVSLQGMSHGEVAVIQNLSEGTIACGSGSLRDVCHRSGIGA